MDVLNSQDLDKSFIFLEAHIRQQNAEPIQIVVCGGSALIATNLIKRTTKDVDIIALIDLEQGLKDPDPLPEYLVSAAKKVAENLGLPDDWLNTGPADLFRMGLPDGFEDRLIEKNYGTHLSVFFISRIDQIYFKLYASVDRGGYHISDLLALNPEGKEILAAAKWSQTHDVSEGYTYLLKEVLSQLGYGNAAAEI